MSSIAGGHSGELKKPPLPPRPTSPMVAPLSATYESRNSPPVRTGLSITLDRPRNVIAAASSSASKLSPGRSMGSLSEFTTGGAERVTPDFSARLNRSPPRISKEDMIISEIDHKGSVKCWALSGFHLCTAGQQNLRVYYLPSGENVRSLPLNDIKITGMVFAPCRNFENEGRFLWIALEKGDIAMIDIQSGNQLSLADRKNYHSGTITHLLRYRRSIWSYDENGSLKIWSPDESGIVTLNTRPRTLGVNSRQEKLAIAMGRLWTTAGRDIYIYDPNDQSSLMSNHIDLTGIAGNISCMSVNPSETTVFSGHENGKIIAWDSVTYVKRQIVDLGVYRITSLLALSNGHIWTGFMTGKIQVFDSVTENWSILKDFTAHHESPVSDIILDERSLLMGKRQTVTTLSGKGNIRFWDGFLLADWRENYVKEREAEFCTHREIRMFVGSWNLDANKPEAMDGRRKEDQVLQQWFSKLKSIPPEILVIGFQELVDLESKKVNAKQIFFEATKNSSKAHLDHRFAAWRDRLIKTVQENFDVSYRVIECQQMVGLFQCIFILEREAQRCKALGSAQVKTGLGGFHGNKGSIATRLILDDSSICFLNCHLAAHQSQVSARNNDSTSIRDGLNFPQLNLEGVFMPGGNGSIVSDHENIIIFGDLNYRVDLPRDQVIDAINRKDWNYLLDNDQLRKQLRTNTFGFRGFVEAPINFAPTFKYDVGSDEYDTSEKKRVPAYCDRILSRGKNLRQFTYERYESTISDHRPISGTFSLLVKSISQDKMMKCKREADEISRLVIAKQVETAQVVW
ncbi:hypothetical protein HDU76_011920 [Blyttiomyces sp. JEL0837]|nr:hypothetical protein HDU76_011920 [Blyttiomyces sp. JEL0837]